MNIRENVRLAQYTTFKIGGPARFLCIASSESDVVDAVAFARERSLSIFVMGGGSNLLVSDEGFAGLVIKMEIGGIENRSAPTTSDAPAGRQPVIITAGAGIQWDDFVAYAVDCGLYGVENLSAIPGTVGAAPVQNVGAYGVEAAQVISSVRAFDMQTSSFVELSNADCRFGYRDSMFKHEKGRYIITRVSFSLAAGSKTNITYKDLQNYFDARGITTPSLIQTRAAVIDIRWHKLPDWRSWGTAGSFFKNPVISAEHFKKLLAMYPGLPGFPESDGRIKVPAGYILDKICNAKGLTIGDVGTYEKQALVVVVRKTDARAADVVAFTRELMRQVKEKTDIDLEAEVEWVN